MNPLFKRYMFIAWGLLFILCAIILTFVHLWTRSYFLAAITAVCLLFLIASVRTQFQLLREYKAAMREHRG